MPLTLIVPEVGFSKSAMTRRNVVLPQPDGPMKETNSPLATSRLISASALTGPSLVSKVRLSRRAETTVAPLDIVAASRPTSLALAAAALTLIDQGSTSMPTSTSPTCRLLRAEGTFEGKQGFRYFEGIAQETVGSTHICMHLLTIPPGGRAKAHKHEHHET